MEDANRICSLVSYFHSPFLAGLQGAIQVLKELSSSEGGLLPGGILAGKVHTGFVGMKFPMLDVKKVSRHTGD